MSSESFCRKLTGFIFLFTDNLTSVFPTSLSTKTLQRFPNLPVRGRIYHLHESFIFSSNKSTRLFNNVIDYIPPLKSEDHESSVSSAKSTGGTISEPFCPEPPRLTSSAGKPPALQLLQVLLVHCAA